MKKYSLLLVLIVVLFLIKGFLLVFLTPPWEAPDESAHVSYVWYLYNFKKLPSKFTPFIPTSIEKSLKSRKNIIRDDLFDRYNRSLEKKSVEIGSHPPLYYLYLLPFYRISLLFNSYTTLIILRFATLILAVVSIVFTFLIAKKILNNSLALLTAALVAFQPMFSFIGSIVNNDMMVVVFFLFIVFISLQLLKRFDEKTYIMSLLTVAFAPLVKPQLLIVFPLFLILAIMIRKKKQWIFLFYLSFIPTILWFGFQYFRYGKSIFTYSVQNALPGTTSPFLYPIEFIMQKQPVGIFMSFWGYFGWLDLPMPKWLYGLIFLIIMISLFGWVKSLKDFRLPKLSRTAFFLCTAFFLYLASIFIFDIQVFMLSRKFVIHGRYLLPVLPLLLVFLVKGLSRYQTYRRFLYLLFFSIILLAQIVAIFTIKNFYYG